MKVNKKPIIKCTEIKGTGVLLINKNGTRLHINAVKSAVDGYFIKEYQDEQIVKGKGKKKEVINLHHPVRVNDRDFNELWRHAKKKLDLFLQSHPYNTRKIFCEQEINRAEEFQSYFFSRRFTDTTHKEYYYRLKRWIELLERFKY